MLNRPNVHALAAWSAIGGGREDVPHKSIVVWPDTVSIGNAENSSEDTHGSAGAARAVCRGIMREGLGGMREIFPLSVRVEPV
jgi:hypothetical protein